MAKLAKWRVACPSSSAAERAWAWVGRGVYKSDDVVLAGFYANANIIHYNPHPTSHTHTHTHSYLISPTPMEFHSTNPPPLPQYHYLAKAIITLYPTNTTANNNTDSLQRTTSRGSIGRRLSFGSAGKLDEDGDPVLGGAGGQNPERGGGLRNFARRLSFDTKGKDGKDAREGLKDEHATTGGAGAGVLDIAKTKTGKWATNVEVAVTAVSVFGDSLRDI